MPSFEYTKLAIINKSVHKSYYNSIMLSIFFFLKATYVCYHLLMQKPIEKEETQVACISRSKYGSYINENSNLKSSKKEILFFDN